MSKTKKRDLEGKEPRFIFITSLMEDSFFLAPPMGLYRLKYALELDGFEADVWDQNIDDEGLYHSRIVEGYYDVVGYSVTHLNMKEDLEHIWALRKETPEHEILFLGGGQEATMNSEQWLKNGLDLILTGYAEQSVVHLANNMRQDNSSLNTMTKGMNGYSYLDDGHLVMELGIDQTHEQFTFYTYDFVLADVIPFEIYWQNTLNKVGQSVTSYNGNKFVSNIVRLFTSSQCVRGCGFCSSQSFLRGSSGKNQKLKFLEAEKIYNLLVFFIKKGATGVLFSDDNFMLGTKLGRDRAITLSNLLLEGHQNGEVSNDFMLNCQARIDDFILKNEVKEKVVNDSLLGTMHAAGFSLIGMGVETFSDRLLQCPSITKRGVTCHDCLVVLDAMLERGMKPQVNIIVGIPETSPEELLETIKIAAGYIKRGCQVAVTRRVLNFPGAPMRTRQEYKTVYKEIQNPMTGAKVEIEDYFKAFNPEVEKVIVNMAEVQQREIKRMWKGQVIPKHLTALSSFLAIAIILDEEEVIESLKQVINFLSIDEVRNEY